MWHAKCHAPRRRYPRRTLVKDARAQSCPHGPDGTGRSQSSRHRFREPFLHRNRRVPNRDVKDLCRLRSNHAAVGSQSYTDGPRDVAQTLWPYRGTSVSSSAADGAESLLRRVRWGWPAGWCPRRGDTAARVSFLRSLRLNIHDVRQHQPPWSACPVEGAHLVLPVSRLSRHGRRPVAWRRRGAGHRGIHVGAGRLIFRDPAASATAARSTAAGSRRPSRRRSRDARATLSSAGNRHRPAGAFDRGKEL